MTENAIRRTLEDLGARLFRRDHPNRQWRPSPDDGLYEGASREERALYRCFAVGLLRERGAGSNPAR